MTPELRALLDERFPSAERVTAERLRPVPQVELRRVHVTLPPLPSRRREAS